MSRICRNLAALGFILAAPIHATLAQASADTARKTYNTADVSFVSGMISHHAQAVLMAGWAPTHGASASIRSLCDRIVVAQNDEIAVMQRWLRERHLPVPPPDPRGEVMPGMDRPMPMPGMLTPPQMAQLDSARGPAFDHLFLADMVQHHRGAITMVNQLLDANAARDPLVFQMASDINADQTAEIGRMTRMLDAMTRTQRSSQ